MTISSTILIIFACLLSLRCTAFRFSAGSGKFASYQRRRTGANGVNSINNHRAYPGLFGSTKLLSNVENKDEELEVKEPSAFDQVASKGLAGVLAIAAAEAIFWALGVPLASLWVKYTTGEWIDLMTTDGQLQAAGFSFGYGGFATLILQYRVTLFAIPLVPIMEKLVVTPGKKYFGEQFGAKKD